jgi:polyferredoxin
MLLPPNRDDEWQCRLWPLLKFLLFGALMLFVAYWPEYQIVPLPGDKEQALAVLATVAAGLTVIQYLLASFTRHTVCRVLPGCSFDGGVAMRVVQTLLTFAI